MQNLLGLSFVIVWSTANLTMNYTGIHFQWPIASALR